MKPPRPPRLSNPLPAMSESFLDDLPSPDAIGSTEYRAILETLASSTDDPEHAAAICDEFAQWGTRLAGEIREWHRNHEDLG